MDVPFSNLNCAHTRFKNTGKTHARRFISIDVSEGAEGACSTQK